MMPRLVASVLYRLCLLRCHVENLKQGFCDGFWFERSQVQHDRECVSNSYDFLTFTGAYAARPVARIERLRASATTFASAPPSFDRHPRMENVYIRFLPLCSSCPPRCTSEIHHPQSASERTLLRKATRRICGQLHGCCRFSLTPPNQLEPASSLSSLLSSPSFPAAEPIK